MAVGIGLIAAMCGLVLVVGGTVFWVWALVDCLRNEPSEGNDKVVWMLVIVFLHLLGALLYFLVRRPERIARFGS